ncbi:hypothetical protein G6M46_16075 [Agrobacterium tumefaciens]|uniref:HD-GYP domain-containing protein n=1 Tax=Agrobacterium tumefaciens TaxID=358 RepID=A0AA44F6U5_AGRTU|nr:hypothetical protein [Agrobacterium tumefaciens]NTC16121.1 hypothetical protein [Agrobacterium tumefaciens]NTC29654.1 hypothetical protein [Agrobacterium tumefaciens]
MGGLLHDLGKVKIPLDILNKNGPLTGEEMAVVRKHPQQCYDLLFHQGDMADTVLDICLHHDERLDGRGSTRKDCPVIRSACLCALRPFATSTMRSRQSGPIRKHGHWLMPKNSCHSRRGSSTVRFSGNFSQFELKGPPITMTYPTGQIDCHQSRW